MGRKMKIMINSNWKTIGDSLKPGEKKHTSYGTIHNLPLTPHVHMGCIMVAHSVSNLSSLLPPKHPSVIFVRVADGDILCHKLRDTYKVHVQLMKSYLNDISETFRKMDDSVKQFILPVALYHYGQLLLGLDKKLIRENTSEVTAACFCHVPEERVSEIIEIIGQAVQELVKVYVGTCKKLHVPMPHNTRSRRRRTRIR